MQAAAMAPAERKEPMNVYVRLNQNPTVGIDPDAVVLEQPGVIALRDKGQDEKGDVHGLHRSGGAQGDRRAIEDRAQDGQDGVTNKTGVFHVVIQLNGTLADAEAWVKTFDFDAMLGVIDPQ